MGIDQEPHHTHIFLQHLGELSLISLLPPSLHPSPHSVKIYEYVLYAWTYIKGKSDRVSPLPRALRSYGSPLGSEPCTF